jgi:hypothetical protein
MPSRIGGVLVSAGTRGSNPIGGKSYTPVAYYPSSSSNTGHNCPQGFAYTVCEVDDGTLSCDCLGWTRRNPSTGRTCKHTEDFANFLVSDRTKAAPSLQVLEDKVTVQEKANTKGGSLEELLRRIEKEGNHA